MKKSSISVIIPVYNEEKYIGACLSSLCKQTLLPIEVVVVDDGSTDKTPSVLSGFQSLKFKFIRLRTKHQGPGLARNLGAARASGEILVFVDGDMTFNKNYLKKLVRPIRKGKAETTFTREEYVANPEDVWSKCWSVNSYLPANLHIDPNIPNEAANFRAIKRELFFKTKGYLDVGYGEDVTVLRQLSEVKAKVAAGAICYHYNPSSLWEVFVSSRWMGRGEVIEFGVRSLIVYSLPNSLRRGVWEAIRRRLVWFVVFKVVADLGVLIGLLERKLGRKHIK